jgi:CRISPR-associated endonuclease/helicase Cas3
MSSPITIELEPKSIASCEPPEELKFLGHTLQHQVDVFEKSRDHDIIMDLAPTGTGKTKASLSVLLHNHDRSAIYIAPTNALVEQQTEAAKQFVKDAGLNHFVIAASAKEVRAWSNDRVGSRPGEKIYNLLRNPAIFFPELEEYRPILLVTNPDLFYYATFFCYNRLDRVNLASSFYNQFATVIIDEFHLYNSKQLVSLFFYLSFSKVFKFFDDGRKIVLLTATPEKVCELALIKLESQGVKIAKIGGEEITDKMLPSQTSVNLEIRPQPDRDVLLDEIANEVAERFDKHPDRNGAIILDSLDHINRLKDRLRQKGLNNFSGRITGAIKDKRDRKESAQLPIILATSTVDVGFNFERNIDLNRQNLDWLIFSVRDRAAFWQRIGRVGRVLGKTKTNIPSDAIAYLPETAWEQGIADLNCNGGRSALWQKLEELPCLEKPFLQFYWQSEAFLEIARPLLEIEEKLENLPEANLIPQLFETMRSVLGGKRTWAERRYRMIVLRASEQIARENSPKAIQEKWRHIKGGSAFIKKFLQTQHPEKYNELEAGSVTIGEWEKEFQEYEDAATELKEFAEFWSKSYAPLFQFRDGLFENLRISDPNNLILDFSEETDIDPIHLLRHYEFVTKDSEFEIVKRANPPYTIGFSWRFHGSKQGFINTEINKLTVLENCKIQRTLDGAIFPTPLLKSLEKDLLSGVIICPIASHVAYFKLRKMGIMSYPITVKGNDFEKEYAFLPALSGILTAAMAGVKIRLMDEENFWIA